MQKFEGLNSVTKQPFGVDVGYERFLGPEIFFHPEVIKIIWYRNVHFNWLALHLNNCSLPTPISQHLFQKLWTQSFRTAPLTLEGHCIRISYCQVDRPCLKILVGGCNEISSVLVTLGSKSVNSWVEANWRWVEQLFVVEWVGWTGYVVPTSRIGVIVVIEYFCSWFTAETYWRPSRITPHATLCGMVRWKSTCFNGMW